VPEAVIILVATKIDLRKNTDRVRHLYMGGEAMVTRKEGIARAKEINAYCCILSDISYFCISNSPKITEY
jgi:hypothetical protein